MNRDKEIWILLITSKRRRKDKKMLFYTVETMLCYNYGVLIGS